MKRPKMLVKRIHPDAIMPTYAHDGDSGMDLYTVEDLELAPNATGIAKTGIQVALPPYTELQVRNRSGITVKGCVCRTTDIVLDSDMLPKLEDVNKLCYERVMLGTVDNPYRGEIGIMVYNQENKTIVIPKGTKLAQAVVCPVVLVDVEEVDELSETSRGENGYGSTEK